METHVDLELIDGCIRGDQAAWGKLVRRYQRLVYSVAHTLCRPEDVSDVFQQVWMELHQQLSTLRRVEALPAWLITVTRRRCYATHHSRERSEQLPENLRDNSERLTQIEREHAIERALQDLPDRCRQLIQLLYLDADAPSYEQIAKRLEMPVSSIGPTRARCLEKLRKLLT